MVPQKTKKKRLKWPTMLNDTEKSRRCKKMKSEKNSLDLRNKIVADITNFSDTEEAET